MAGFAYGFDEGGAIPDDQGEKRGRKKSTFEQDIDAGRGPADTEQYGRPQYTDEVNESAGMDMSAPTPSPPISTSNFDQGAIPVDESAGLNTGAIPEDESAGLDTSAPQQQGGRSYGPLAGADFNPAHVPANVKRILQYLMGADAAPPEVADKFKRGAQAEHGLDESDANLVAVHKAGEAGGDDAAHQMLQYNRMAYNAKQSFAKAALTGVQGKPPDMQAAAGAATQASHHVLDGSNAVFVANPSGVTATVKMPGTNSRVSYNLTPQQFSQYLDVGGDGQWDKLMEQGGVPAALQKIVGSAKLMPTMLRAGGQQTAQARDDRGTQPLLRQDQQKGGYDPNQPEGPGGQYQGEDDGRVKPPPGTLFNPPRNRAAQRGEPGYSEAAHAGQPIIHSMNAPINAPHGLPGYRDNDPNPMGDQPAFKGHFDENGHWLGPKTTSKTNFDPDLEARADQMFGKGLVSNPQRTQWMSEQENQQEERQVKRDVAEGQERARIGAARERSSGQVGAAHERRMGAENAATTRAAGYAQAQQQKAQIALQKMAQQHLDNDARDRINVATRLINNPNWATQDKGERDAILKYAGVDKILKQQLGEEPTAPSPRMPQQTPPAAAPQQRSNLSAQDQQAIAWANAHPNDPRAAKIKQLHGM